MNLHSWIPAFAGMTIIFSCSVANADVKIRSYYPVLHSEYANENISDVLTVGAAGAPATSTFYGNLNASGALTVLKDTASTLRVAPDAGPWGKDGLRVDTDGKVYIGSDGPTDARLKVHTVLRGRDLYALGDVSNPRVGYLKARGFQEGAQMKAQFAGIDAVGYSTFAPLRIDGAWVELGESFYQRDAWLGWTHTVLIGTQIPETDAAVPPHEIFLQVGALGDGTKATCDDWGSYSSKEYKTDIAPLTRQEYGDILLNVQNLNVVRFHYKNEDKRRKKWVGILAEEAPKEILSRGNDALSFTDALGFIAAALKELKTRNDALRLRIEELEMRKARLSHENKK